ncbi:MAG: anti-sigma factor [Verrucomicrobiota bacterium]
MKRHEKEERFEWLDAGRALDDLTSEEASEWKTLHDTLSENRTPSDSPDIPLDAIVASLDQGFSPESTIPNELREKIGADAKDFHRDPDVSDETIVRTSFWLRPGIGWAAAAVFALLLLFRLVDDINFGDSDPVSILTQVEAAPDLLRRTFGKANDENVSAGEVIWSDSLQQGVMLLADLPENDPKVSQYQLWIVDSTRDDTHPVDGGVFDIPPATTGPVEIPIAAKLLISNPAAFVITVERPGGVVVSKQEQVVAIAKS